MPVSLDPDSLDTWRAFLGAHSRLTQAIERDLEAAGVIPLTWYDVLYALHQAPGRCLRMHELADAVVLSRSGLTRLVDRLHKAGLVQRERCPEDGRGQFAVLSRSGTAALRRAWPVYANSIREHFARLLTPADARRLAKVFSAAGTPR
ncbi:MAG: MarR family transcriptional regulator [Gammaproteobacteria bacterium]|nr:MarR family transcriptional regulator [Gammaproteobacteria bacterium]